MNLVPLIAYRVFENPYMLLLAIPAIFVLIFFMNKDLVKFPKDKHYLKKLKVKRQLILASRIIIILALAIATASPYSEKSEIVKGDPKIKILIDNSTSMQLYETNKIIELKKELEKRISAEMEYIAVGEETNLGDSIIANLRRNDNILLFTDGNSNKGIELGDASLYAIGYNSSISAIQLKPKYYDASVSITGSDKTVSNAENTFIVNIIQTEKRPVYLTVEVDGSKIIDKSTDEEQIKFTRTFDKGWHRITAKIVQDDHFTNNNAFYKTVKVVPKPKVAIYGGNNDLFKLLEPIYELSIIEDINDNLNTYSALIVDNKEATLLNDKTTNIASYISEGNGMIVIGGDKSYDSGGYKGSRFEQILPVFVSKAGRKKGETNIVFVIDISGSTGHYFGGSLKVDVEKSLAIGMIKDLSLTNYVGAVAFNDRAYTIVDVGLLSQQKELEDRISRLKYSGNTYIEEGILKAVEMLQGRGGSKNIILISDGKTQHMDESENSFKVAASKGIRIYSVGVGDDTYRGILQDAADITSGIYFEPEKSQGIKLLFGDLETAGGKKVYPIYIVNDNHFITHGLKLTANFYGFNQVIPKTSSKLLVTTDIGDPILTIGRYGLGRTASLSTDYGTYGFELLNKENSILITRTINWAIGDPERKNENFIDIKDGRIGGEIEVIVKSKEQPSSDKTAFYKIDEDLYRGSLRESNAGFNSLKEAVFAVNYKQEYQDIGMNEELNKIISATNGKMFNEGDAEGIVEFVKSSSKRQIISKKSYSWIFLLIALLFYLAEVCTRRIAKNKSS